MKLLNFQGCCRISDEKIFFAGGINVNYKKISSHAFIYDLKSKAITRIPQMQNLRYTFSLIKFKNFVYAIGGWEYGSDFTAIMKSCERFNLNTD